MTLVWPALLSAAHVVGIASAVTFSAFRLVALRWKDPDWTRWADNGNGLAAIVLYGSGLWRLFGEIEKPLAFYTANPVFWMKVGLLVLAGVLELYPQYVVLPWHFRVGRGLPVEPKPGQFEWMFRCAAAQLPLLLGIVLCAALMSRGVGLEATSPAAPTVISGRDLYVRHCQVCHQADGRGLGGTAAVDFIGDPSVLERPDTILLASIADGKRGAIGTMPPWGSVLSEAERVAVLAHLREAYGSGADVGAPP